MSKKRQHTFKAQPPILNIGEPDGHKLWRRRYDLTSLVKRPSDQELLYVLRSLYDYALVHSVPQLYWREHWRAIRELRKRGLIVAKRYGWSVTYRNTLYVLTEMGRGRAQRRQLSDVGVTEIEAL
mgnify:CR=1 FL=1